MSGPLAVRLSVRLSQCPTELRVHPEENDACCKMHRVIQCGISGAEGCVGVNHGKHASIACAYRGVIRGRCYADEGALKLDERLVRQVLSDNFVGRCGFEEPHRNVQFNLYAKGSVVRPDVFGAGYCYLKMFGAGTWFRAARILGPLPLLSDVARIGWTLSGGAAFLFCVEKVSGGVYHVLDGTERSGIRRGAGIRQLLGILEKEPDARVGWNFEDIDCFGWLTRCAVDRPQKSFSQFDSPVGVEPCIYVREMSRVRALEMFLHDKGVVRPMNFYDDLIIVSSSFLELGSNNQAIKRCKNFAILGDVALKLYAASATLSKGVDSASYDRAGKFTTNKNLSVLLSTTGLRDHCAVSNLNLDSDANATVFEAIIGFVYWYAGYADVLALVSEFAVVPDTVYFSQSRDLRAHELRVQRYRDAANEGRVF